MNQIAGVDGFNLMNNLRLVIIVAIFIVLIIVLFLKRILGSQRRAKRKDMQAVNPSDESNREERDAPDVVCDFFGEEESTEKEESEGGESTAEPKVEIDDRPVVNYEKIEADLKAVRDEVTTKIERLILKVEAVEKEVLNKIEDVIDVKIQEASNKINDRISEAIRTQINSINPVLEERVNSLRKKEVPADILPYEDTVVPEEIKEKEQTDTIVPSGGIEEKISEGDAGKSDDFDIQNVLEEEPVGISSTEEPKESVEEKVEFEEKKSTGAVGESVGPARLFFQKFLSVGIPSTEEPKELVEVEEKDLEAPAKDSDILEKLHLFVRNQLGAFGILPSGGSKTVAEVKKERDLEVSSEVEEDVRVDEKEPIGSIASTGEIEEKISEGDVGESFDFDIEKFLEEGPVGMPSTEESREVEETVEFKKEKEEGLELPAEETVAHEGIDEKEIDTITPTGDIKEKALEATKGEEAEEKKQSTEETVDFDIQEFLEELGTPPFGKDLKSEKDDTDLRSI